MFSAKHAGTIQKSRCKVFGKLGRSCTSRLFSAQNFCFPAERFIFETVKLKNRKTP